MDLPDYDKIQKVVKRLAEILRIQDWDISVQAVTGYELTKYYDDCTCDGISCRNVRLNKADIYLNKEKDVDWYETLVHEMLHIQSTPLIHCAEAYFEHKQSYFTDIYENFTEKQAQIFCEIYPLSNFSAV